MEKISVCIATYNGEKYITDQLKSILSQLGGQDEIIISDNLSTDNTLNMIRLLNDDRIKVYHNDARNVIRNFENAIIHATGGIIFLSDQDDLWKPGKVKKMMNAFVFTSHSNKGAVEFYKSTGGKIVNGDDLMFVYEQ